MDSDGAPVRDDRHGDHVRALERGLAVIRSFDADHAAQTLTEVSLRTGLTKAAARRFLLTLADLGYVRHDGRRFTLRPSILALGSSYLSSLELPEIALPHLEELAAAVGESASMSVLDGGDIVYVARIPTRQRVIRVSIAVGTRFPAYATSMGRVLLAHLADDELAAALGGADLPALTPHTITDRPAFAEALALVRRRGYAVVDQELEEGLRSAAAPVRDASGRVVAAVNVSTHTSRASIASLERDVAPLLVRTGQRISADVAAVADVHGRDRAAGVQTASNKVAMP